MAGPDPRPRGDDIPIELVLKVAAIALPIYGWFALALMAKGFRHIGWGPFVAIVGWGSLAVLDHLAVRYVPRRLAAPDGTQTLFGMLINLVMFASLLFWPGTATATTVSQIDRLDVLSGQGNRSVDGSFGRR